MVEDGAQLYKAACATCHGADGSGTDAYLLGFDVPVPDFTECVFASREPDGDWIGVAHEGGPVRGFSERMPAFGDALSEAQLQLVMDHIRTFCTDDRWPRGELNLPRALFTEKAYPEDEAVLTTTAEDGSVMSKFVYETRFGPRNQIEFVVPFGHQEVGDTWRGMALGDIAIGLKRALYHDVHKGTIFSATAEVKLPTGDEELGFGAGTAKFEPFLSFGQLLPADAFVQAQAGMEFPVIQDKGENEAFWRGVIGKSMARPNWGRTFSPMLEVLAKRELEDGATIHWDLVPQIQITLNTRQHIMMNVGYAVPLGDDDRNERFAIYLLWDWFDGGFTEGW